MKIFFNSKTYLFNMKCNTGISLFYISKSTAFKSILKHIKYKIGKEKILKLYQKYFSVCYDLVTYKNHMEQKCF